VYILKSPLPSNEHLDDWIRQEHIRLESCGVQNGGMRQSSYGDEIGENGLGSSE